MERLAKALRLDPDFYASASEDQRLTREAHILAATAALMMGLGLMLMRIVDPLWWLVGALLWVAVVFYGGARVLVELGRRFGGTADYQQMLRPLGYAMVPQAFGFVPIADFLPGFIIGMVWSSACAVVAVREAHRVPLRLAVALVVAPILVLVGLAPLVIVVSNGGG